MEAETFDRYRPLLFSIAYRMLGSASDAEDMVQEAYLRWHTGGAEAAHNPKAYLSTVITRLCIDQMESARARREVYPGPWLPEPVGSGPGAGYPGENLERAESLSYAFMVLLESLNPVERAVFVLRQVFDYDYGEIARIAGKSEANCRQIIHRAQERLARRQPRFRADRQRQEQLTSQFVQACASGNLEGLLKLFSQDIVIFGDGGGKALAARNPVYGAQNVARFLLGYIKKYGGGYEVRPVEVNHSPALATYYRGKLDGVFCFMFGDGRIEEIYSIRNPDKLEFVSGS